VDKKSKLINIRISPEEFSQIKELADDREMTVSQYVRYMATIFLIKDVKLEIAKKDFSAVQFESDLKQMAKSLDKQKHYIEMMQRSLNTLTWRLESQFRKLRLETEHELKKDISRIKIMMEEESETINQQSGLAS